MGRQGKVKIHKGGSFSAGLQAKHCRYPQQTECLWQGKDLDLNGRSGFESRLSDLIRAGILCLCQTEWASTAEPPIWYCVLSTRDGDTESRLRLNSGKYQCLLQSGRKM